MTQAAGWPPECGKRTLKQRFGDTGCGATAGMREQEAQGMARRIAYRKKRQNRFSMFLAVLVVGLLLVVVSVGSARIMTKLSAYEERKAELEQAIAEEEKRTEQIEEYRKYTQTSKYVEEVAKDKLGLVYDGETIFKDEDSE